MNKLNKTILAFSLVAIAVGGYAFPPIHTGDDGHKVKVKIVKIVDGDTTITEKTVDESELTRINEDLNKVKGKNVKVMMYVNSEDKGKTKEGDAKEEKITMNKSFSFDFDSVMKTCKIELNIDSLVGEVMNGFNMTVITDDDKDGKGEKKVVIRQGSGKEEDVRIQKFGDDEDGNNTFIITTPDDKGGKKEEKVIIKKEKGSNGSYSYTIDSDEGNVNMDLSNGDGKDGSNSVIVITANDKDGKNGKKVIVRSSVIVIDDNDKPDGKKKEVKEERESAGDLKFFPNPSDGRFTVEYDLKSKETAVLTITDANGKQLFRDEIRGGGKYSKQIDLGSSGKGVFILNLQQGKKSISRKIVIE
jgi:hypothetical protein